ncbi:nitrilase [Phakopsora pachyrhizi]|uniref:Nitrilase n=1 Tax=Phakopsora pachyrhizi TaxID=170000 RepID=A0AAV0AUG2_PHAPC|nr:nitrilase [Phakopsora pachyrhizi]
MVFLPEALDFITRSELYPSIVKSVKDSKFLKGFRESAREFGCWISDSFSVKSNTSNIILNNVGQLICYNVRFAEPAIIHHNCGANILSYPSAFTIRTGGAHWETLLKARAIETQCYVIGAAQVGTHIEVPMMASWRHSMIVDPWGTILSRVPDDIPSIPPPSADEDEEWSTSFAIADIDLKSLENLRRSMPIFEQRQYDIYPKLD